MAANTKGRPLKVSEVAERLGVTDRTVRNMIARHELPYVRIMGRGQRRGFIRIDRAVFEEFIRRRTEGGPAAADAG